jgi:hypothetical protein
MEKFNKIKTGKTLLLCIILWSVKLYAVPPPSYTATGTIFTKTGTVPNGCNKKVKRVKVNIVDDDVVIDDLCATGWTLDDGSFSITFTWADADLDMCVDVVGQAQLPDNKYVYIKDFFGLNIIDYEKVEDNVKNEPPSGIVDFGDLNLSDNKCNVLTLAGEAIRFAHDNQVPGTGWTVPQDLIAYPLDTDSGSKCVGDIIHIERKDWDFDTHGYFSDIFHETAHFIMYNAYGDDNPYVAYRPDNGHNFDTESSEGFAMIEGFACYFANVSQGYDLKYDEPVVWVWRGSDNKGDFNDTATGQKGMGEIVEGALMNTWCDINDFGKVFSPIANDSPDSFYQWLEDYNNYGYSMLIALEMAQNNGIIYSRGKISLTESPPPGNTPKSDGNVKEINDVTFIRGEIVPTITALEKNVDLLLGTSASTFEIDKKKLGYKIVSTDPVSSLEDRDDDVNDIPNFTYLSELNWTDNIEFDTTLLKEGAYDLVVKTRNIHSWWDDLRYPSFDGDAETTKNTEEKWLKHLNTWYNQDTEASDDNEGKVIIDNTPPEITNEKPAQN